MYIFFDALSAFFYCKNLSIRTDRSKQTVEQIAPLTHSLLLLCSHSPNDIPRTSAERIHSRGAATGRRASVQAHFLLVDSSTIMCWTLCIGRVCLSLCKYVSGLYCRSYYAPPPPRRDDSQGALCFAPVRLSVAP